MTELQKVGEVSHCSKCLYQFIEGTVEARPANCPRCAYDLTIIDITDALVTKEELRNQAGMREISDLMKMMENWSKAHRRVIVEEGLDWSAPHEYMEDIFTIMMPYLGRLKQAGYIGQKEGERVLAYMAHQLERIVLTNGAAEEKLKLEGKWDAKEQEIKDYWDQRLQKESGVRIAHILQLPMRYEQWQSRSESRLQVSHEEDS
jgi:hypothetical protein